MLKLKPKDEIEDYILRRCLETGAPYALWDESGKTELHLVREQDRKGFYLLYPTGKQGGKAKGGKL